MVSSFLFPKPAFLGLFLPVFRLKTAPLTKPWNIRETLDNNLKICYHIHIPLNGFFI